MTGAHTCSLARSPSQSAHTITLQCASQKCEREPYEAHYVGAGWRSFVVVGVVVVAAVVGIFLIQKVVYVFRSNIFLFILLEPLLLLLAYFLRKQKKNRPNQTNESSLLQQQQQQQQYLKLMIKIRRK